jgi:hypothetical protein
MAITRSQMKRQLYSIGGGAIKGTDAGNGREGFFRPVPGSPMANLLNTLPPGDLRHYGIGFGGGPGYKNLGASTGGGFGPQTGNEAIYPRLGDLRSGVSSAEQELQDILQSINQVQSTLGAPSEGDGYPKIPAAAIAAGSPFTADTSSQLGTQSPLSSVLGFGAVGDPRLGAPVIPGNKLQMIMRGDRANGGMMGRQMYGLGSFIKKAVKGVAGAVKNFAKSDAGKLALLAAAGYGLGGGTFFGRTLPGISSTGGFAFGNIPTNIGGIMGLKSGKENLLGNVLKVGGYGSVLGGALAGYGGDEEDTIGGERNVEALRAKLTQAYRNLRYPEDQIPGLVENDLAEYTMGAGGYANGGRIGYGLGSLVSGSAGVFKPTSDSMSAGDAPSFEGGSGMGGMIADLIRKNPQMLSFEEAKAMNPGMFSAEVETDVVRPNTELLNYIKRIRDAAEKGIIPMDFAMDLVKQKTMEQGVDLQGLRDDIMETQRIEQAYGGRIGFFKGAQADARAGKGAMSPGTSMSGGFRGGGDGGGNKDTTPKISEVIKNISNLSNVPAFEKISNLESIYGLGSSGLPSRARHMAAMNVLSNALSKTGLGVAMGIPSKLAGDMGAFGMGLINEIPALGRGLTKENLSEIGEDIADNFRGTFLTPNTMTTEQIYSNVYGRPGVRQGGRMQYAFGSPEENAMRASGIMNLPLNQNPAGVTELDLRDSGGFIPPVGVKEKADDIPAMLSNNEFVFTADAVRGMGNGDVNEGAQRMYDMMKKLENGGRV